MSPDLADSNVELPEELEANLERVAHNRTAEVEPRSFWPACAETLSRVAGASFGMVLVREAEGPWKRIALWPVIDPAESRLQPFMQAVEGSAGHAVEAGTALVSLGPGGRGGGDFAAAVRLVTEEAAMTCVAVVHLRAMSRQQAQEGVARLRLTADTPAVYQVRRLLRQARQDVAHFTAVLEMITAMNREKRFLAAALTFCNELAGRHRCERVSLGWQERGRYMRLEAISHTERFDRKMEAVKSLEYLMEEALDQDDEIAWPAPEHAPQVSRDHGAYAAAQGVAHLCSLPLRHDGEPVGAVTFERSADAFGEDELRLLRIACDLAEPRLYDLKKQDRWFGARWAAAAREKLAKLVGVEHTWWKILGVVIAVGLGVLLFGRTTYRVEAPFVLHADDLAYVPAPFDGYIREVHMRVGDEVEPGDALLDLDNRDLLLEEAAAAADYQRYLREAEKARAEGALADMRIASALADQSRARLDLVRYRLERARIAAPFEGVVVEGDLRERIGSPVAKGDVLFRVAHLGGVYVKLKVDESDVHHLRSDAEGQIAFASRPRLKFPVTVERVDPVATPEEGENVFTVRCRLGDRAQAWWRPGMSGVAKIEAGRRSFLWIFTHRTVDFLRMKLWW